MEENLKIQTTKEKIEREIISRKRELYFGLCSWILKDYKESQEYNQIQKYYSTIQTMTSSNLEELTKTFLDCYNTRTPSFWGWDTWGDYPQGEAVWIDTESNLILFFCIKSLNILSSISDEQIDLMELPYNRALVFLIEGTDSRINQILRKIESEPKRWEGILGPEALSEKPNFLKLLKKAKIRQRKV